MKPRFLPKFPLWVDDWLSSSRVNSMTAEQEGAYLRLCLFQWRDGSLPPAIAALLRLGRLTEGDHAVLIDAFPICEDGLRRNAKVAAVRAEADAFLEEQARKSKLGGAANAERIKRARGLDSGYPGGSPDRAPPTPTLTLQIEEKKAATRRPRSARRPLEVSDLLGTGLDVPGFIDAFRSWETVHGRYKPAGLAALVKRLAGWGAVRATNAIHYSLAQGYQGIFEEKSGGPQAPRGPKITSRHIPEYHTDNGTPRNMNPPSLSELLKQQKGIA